MSSHRVGASIWAFTALTSVYCFATGRGTAWLLIAIAATWISHRHFTKA